MSRVTAINLAELPFPGVVQTLDFEQVLAELKADLAARTPDTFTELVLESSTVTKQLEVFAEREINLRARVNDAAKAVMLAHAKGSDLENLHPVWVQRQVIQPAGDTANPPIAAVMENDDSLRYRKQLAMEGFSSAGPVGAYQHFARAADPQVKDVAVFGPQLVLQDGQLVSTNGILPGNVEVVALTHTDTGTASEQLLQTLDAALNQEDVRPLTDHVIVKSATVHSYAIEARLSLLSGPDTQLVLQAATTAAQEYANAQHRIGAAVSLSGLYAALHQAGVTNVTIASPANGIAASDNQAPYCTGVTVTEEGA